MVDAGFLAAMRDGALLVNAARGVVVDTDALLAELDRRPAAGGARRHRPGAAARRATRSGRRPGLLLTPHVGRRRPGHERARGRGGHRPAGPHPRRRAAGERGRPLLIAAGGSGTAMRPPDSSCEPGQVPGPHDRQPHLRAPGGDQPQVAARGPRGSPATSVHGTRRRPSERPHGDRRRRRCRRRRAPPRPPARAGTSSSTRVQGRRRPAAQRTARGRHGQQCGAVHAQAGGGVHGNRSSQTVSRPAAPAWRRCRAAAAV